MGDLLIENGVLKKYRGTDREVIIPDGVTRIGSYAFSGCGSLTGVTLPGITDIGDHAFAGCENLKGITIPDSVARIGEFAFFGCSGLTDITLPAGVTGIGRFSFGRCFGLKSVTLPDSIVSIGEGAFWMCTSLAGITLPDIDRIEGHVFQGCESLRNVIIPDSVTAIGEEAFSGCESLKSVTIPDNVTAIGEEAFSGCESLRSVTIPDSVIRVGDRAFYGCRDLTDITIPSAAEYGERVFSGCSALEDETGSVVINGTLYAVDETEKNLTIPGNVLRIDPRAFGRRRVIETVFAPGLRLGILTARGMEIPAVRAFIQRCREYSDPAVIADYIEYISARRKALLPEILKADAVDVLRLLTEAKEITISNLKRNYLMQAVRCGAGECAAYIDTLPGFRTVPHIIKLHGLRDGVHFTPDGEEMLRAEMIGDRDMDTIDRIRACYREHHKEKTLRHAEEVALTAAGLAGIHGLDPEKAKLAALLHDISAVMTPRKMYYTAVSRGMELDPAEEKYHFLLHQRISRIMAEEMFSVTDPDILSAVECHTTLKAGAGAYDELIFISDKISWDQEGEPPYHDKLLALAEGSLDEACCFYIKYQFDHGLLLMPHGWMTGAYEDLKKRLSTKG